MPSTESTGSAGHGSPAGRRRRDANDTWFVMSVSSSEASGPSGAGARASAARNPRGSSEMRLTVPRLRSRRA